MKYLIAEAYENLFLIPVAHIAKIVPLSEITVKTSKDKSANFVKKANFENHTFDLLDIYQLFAKGIHTEVSGEVCVVVKIDAAYNDTYDNCLAFLFSSASRILDVDDMYLEDIPLISSELNSLFDKAFYGAEDRTCMLKFNFPMDTQTIYRAINSI